MKKIHSGKWAALLLCLVAWQQSQADVADSLSVTVTESEWTGGVTVTLPLITVSGIKQQQMDAERRIISVFNTKGQLLKKDIRLSEAINTLPKGVYIIERRKFVVR